MPWLSPSLEGRDMRASLPCSPHCCSQVGTDTMRTDILALSDTFSCDRKGQRVSPSQAHTGPRGQGLPCCLSGGVCAAEAQSAWFIRGFQREGARFPPWLAWKHTLVLISSFPVLLAHPLGRFSGITSQNQSPCLTDSVSGGGRGRLKQSL